MNPDLQNQHHTHIPELPNPPFCYCDKNDSALRYF